MSTQYSASHLRVLKVLMWLLIARRKTSFSKICLNIADVLSFNFCLVYDSRKIPTSTQLLVKPAIVAKKYDAYWMESVWQKLHTKQQLKERMAKHKVI